MILGYNTNGFAHHRLADAIEVLAEIGYRSVAITLDHQALNPYDDAFTLDLTDVAALLRKHQMRSVIETGARFLLDPRTKHEPTLLTADPAQRQRRIGFLKHAIEIAAALGSDCVALWSGVLRDDISDGAAMDRLVASLQPVIEQASQFGVVLGFEPEPGMLIDTMARYEALLQRVNAPCLQLTLDVGHLHCQREIPITDQIRRWSDRIVNVHIEDMRAGVHEHLMFGEGEMDFAEVLTALSEVNYLGGLHVELSRHSHDAPAVARRALDFLAGRLENARRRGT